jgi:hypothetical protein
MKKLILASVLAFSSTMSFAAATALAADTAAGHPLTQAQCGVIGAAETATIRLSAGVAGAYECSDTVAVIGTFHSQGRGRTYIASSVGGAITENTSTAVGTDVTAAFTAASASSN